MSQFKGSFTNKLDAKGRVSIPATFRAALPPVDGMAPLVLWPSYKDGCVEGWPAAEFSKLASPLSALERFSDDQEALARVLYADSADVEPDKEGRIVLPADLVAHAGLSESVMFMGMGSTFQIWEPAAGERSRAEARERARVRGLTLRGGVT